MIETQTLSAMWSSENTFIDLRQPMHVGQELDDSHHASTHTNVQGSWTDTEKMLLHWSSGSSQSSSSWVLLHLAMQVLVHQQMMTKAHTFSELLITKYIYFIWNSEFSTVQFGQIMSPSFGTIHYTKGNHYGVNGDVGKTQQIWITSLIVYSSPSKTIHQ